MDERRKRMSTPTEMVMGEMMDKIKQLEQKLAIAVEALEFYSQPWEIGYLDGETLVRKWESYDLFEEVHQRAAKALAKIRGME
jgi:hypothetical protein